MRLIVLLFLALVPTAAAANDICHDLWYTRNQIMDRAGYCFSSTLGEAVFDNSNCVGKNVTISSASKRLVSELQSLERHFGCRVDTGSRWLDLDDVSVRERLIDLPVPEEFPGGCIGWLGPVTPLHAGRDHTSPVIGRINPGDYVLFDHVVVGNWHYVTARDSNWNLIGGGWLAGHLSEFSCRQIAG